MARRAASGWKPSAGGDFKIESIYCQRYFSAQQIWSSKLVSMRQNSLMRPMAEVNDSEYFKRLTELFDLYTSPDNYRRQSPVPSAGHCR